MKQCCSHDNDFDGNCRVHAAIGITRITVDAAIMKAMQYISSMSPDKEQSVDIWALLRERLNTK